MSTAQATADQRHRAYMRQALGHAATHFRLTVTGEPVYGWYDRSISARATSVDGAHWLRVATEHVRWASGEYWTGNADAASITGVPKPRVTNVHEWDETPNRLRAEVMTLLPGHACSPTNELHSSLQLGANWWSQLRGALDNLAQTPTRRVAVDQQTLTRRLLVFFGNAVDPTVDAWTTAHADLHWNNLLAPELGIVDWESWGRAPAGLDAATLYCYSLLVPHDAQHARSVFADQLDSPDGRRAQLYVITRLLLRIENGDNPDLATPLHRHAAKLLGSNPVH